MTNCSFSGNSATIGGGMSNTITNTLFTGSPTVTNCTFSGNTAVTDGGGVWHSTSTSNSRLTVTSCIFWGNVDSGGMDESGQIHTASGIVVVDYSDVQGGWTGAGGAGNINADPLFIDADGADNMVGTEDDDLRLSAGSPCIDRADSLSGGFVPPVDLAGAARAVNDPATPDMGVGLFTFLDMGAYEFQAEQADCPADLNGDGGTGAADLAQLLASWGPCP